MRADQVKAGDHDPGVGVCQNKKPEAERKTVVVVGLGMVGIAFM